MQMVTGAFMAAQTLIGFLLAASFAQDIVILSSKNLSAVPDDLPPTVKTLDLSCNSITALHMGDFQNTTLLRFLNMSWNSLGEIHPQTFFHTPLLESLDLSHNELKNLSGQRYLLHTQNLRMLNLTHNDVVSMKLGSEFASLDKLTGLALGAKNISVGDFKNIAELKLHTLCLSLDEKPLYEVGGLKDVQAQRLQMALGGNPAIFPQIIKDALHHFKEVELLNLTEGYNNLSQLLKSVEIYTSHLYLKYVSIIWKDLTNFLNVCFQVSIPHVTASDIVLYKLPYKDTPVVQASNTTSFTAIHVEVKNFFFSQEAVYNFFINMPVTRLTLTGISLIHMTCPESESSIQQMDFSHCAMSDSIFSRVEDFKTLDCKTLVNVRKLNLAGNNLKSLKVLSQRLRYMKSLQYLDASLNLLVYDGVGECLWPSNITKMILNSNSLTDVVFKCLPKEIETLALQNNDISAVPSSVLRLEKLSLLNLGGNRLRDLPVCDTFPGLRVLQLKLNSLHAPSVQNIESCPKLKTLDVSENPFICSCALRSFLSLKFQKENDHTGVDLVGWPSAYRCAYPEALRNSTLNTVTISGISCSTALLVATILCPSVALILVVPLLCRHFDVHWYLKMIWVWTRAKHRARVRARQDDQTGVEFHAFVSYSQHDADWVQDSLLPNLEGPAGGLRICHHEKHFVPGKTIVQNIISCVEKSRRSVFILSGHFVKSEWCHYELYFASHQHLSQGSDSVVLVLLEPLPQYLIPSKYYQLKSMMGRHTYLEWPQDTAKHRLFWANLRAALQANLPNAAVAEQQE